MIYNKNLAKNIYIYIYTHTHTHTTSYNITHILIFETFFTLRTKYTYQNKIQPKNKKKSDFFSSLNPK